MRAARLGPFRAYSFCKDADALALSLLNYHKAIENGGKLDFTVQL
jgi:hypothetical protein